MNIDIRAYIKSNFKGASADEIKSSISESIEKKDEVTLPGLGVLFEIIWINCSEEEKERLIDVLSSQFR